MADRCWGLALTATLDGPELVIRMINGDDHSRIRVADEDPIEALERLEAAAPEVRSLWSLTQLDAALHREGYERLDPWSRSDGGSITAPVTR